MSEVTFAKSFMATLDKRPIKLSADYVCDPRKYPSQSPYVLPRQPHPFPRSTEPTASQKAQSKTIAVTIRPMRGGDVVVLSDVALDNTIHAIKTQYASKTGLSLEKIKLLLNKKPTADLKTLGELGVDADVELSVMVLGGGAAPSLAAPASQAPQKSTSAPATEPESMDTDPPLSGPESEKAQYEAESAAPSTAHPDTADILKTDAFWSDLQAFLSQRLRDEDGGKMLAERFRNAWKA